MKSFTCVLLGALLASSVLALQNSLSPFAEYASSESGWTSSDRKVEFNQTEIGKKRTGRSNRF